MQAKGGGVNFGLGFAIGGVVVLILIAASGDYIPIKYWQCTQTEMVGQSPDRHEECTQYTHKDKP